MIADLRNKKIRPSGRPRRTLDDDASPPCNGAKRGDSNRLEVSSGKHQPLVPLIRAVYPKMSSRIELNFSLRPVRKRWALLMAGILLLGGQALRAETRLPPEEYALFSALLRHGVGTDARQVVIADTTTGDPAHVGGHGEPVADRAKILETTPELLGEWIRLNSRTAPLSATSFHLPIPIVTLSKVDHEQLFSGDNPVTGWQRFYNRYPDSVGLIRLSRAALDARGTHAIVYLEFQCGAECGSGRLVQLSQYPGGGWQIDAGSIIWVAAPKR